MAWTNAHGDTVFKAGENNGNFFGNTKTLSNSNDPWISENEGDSIDPMLFHQRVTSMIWPDNTHGNYDMLFNKGVD